MATDQASRIDQAVDMLAPMVTAVKQFTACAVEAELNKLCAADPTAVGTLIEMRVFCDKKVETDTLAIPYAETKDGPLSIGTLGVLNLVLGLQGLRAAAVFSDDGKTLTGFRVTTKEAASADAEVRRDDGPELREAAPPAEGGGCGGVRRG